MERVLVPAGLWAMVDDKWFYVRPSAEEIAFYLSRAERWVFLAPSKERAAVSEEERPEAVELDRGES